IPLYRTASIGTKHASVVRNQLQDRTFLQACIEQLALNDEQLLVAYVEGKPVAECQVQAALLQQVGEAKLFPVFFGSAITGVGVSELLADLTDLLPSQNSLDNAPLSGVVFKLEKGATGEKVAYVRVFSGSLRVRNFVDFLRRKSNGEIEAGTGKIQKL